MRGEGNMYIFLAHYTNMITYDEVARGIEFDGNFLIVRKSVIYTLWKRPMI